VKGLRIICCSKQILKSKVSVLKSVGDSNNPKIIVFCTVSKVFVTVSSSPLQIFGMHDELEIGFFKYFK